MEDFLQKLYDYFGISKEVGVPMIVSTVTAIVVVILGVLITYFQSVFRKYKVRTQNRLFVKLSLLKLVRQTHTQAVYYRKFAEQLDIDYTGHYSFQFSVLYDIQIFKELDYLSIRQAFLSGLENKLCKHLSSKDFSKMMNIVRYIMETHQTSIDQGAQFAEKIAQLNQLRNDALAPIQLNIERFRLKFLQQLDLKEPLGKFYDQRERIIEDWRSMDHHTLPRNVETYIQKLIGLNRDNLMLVRRYENDIHSVDLNAAINLASICFQNMQNYVTTTSEHYNFLAGQYFKNAEMLMKVNRKLTKEKKS